MSGYIKLERKYFENFLWKEKRVFSKAEAWLDLIQSARFESTIELINGKVIKLEKNEIPISRRYLETRWGWGGTKVMNFLKILLEVGMTNHRISHGQTILTILESDSFDGCSMSKQATNEPRTNHAQTTDKPATEPETNQEYSLEEFDNEIDKKEDDPRTKRKQTIRKLATNHKTNQIKERKEIKYNTPLPPKGNKVSNLGKNEKEKIPEALQIPFCSQKFLNAWQDLLTLPKWKRKPSSALQKSLDKLGKYEEDFAIELMDTALQGNYQGVVFSGTDDAYMRWKRRKNGGLEPGQRYVQTKNQRECDW